jgi:hypothetical protein
MSRETIYTEELADAICERLSNGESLRKICSDESMPCRSTVLDWEEKNDAFRAKCARARARQAHCMVDMQLDEALGCTTENAAAVRVKISAYQWVASKLEPKKYGERAQLELTGKDGGPIETKNANDLTDAQLAAIASAGRPAPIESETGED